MSRPSGVARLLLLAALLTLAGAYDTVTDVACLGDPPDICNTAGPYASTAAALTACTSLCNQCDYCTGFTITASFGCAFKWVIGSTPSAGATCVYNPSYWFPDRTPTNFTAIRAVADPPPVHYFAPEDAAGTTVADTGVMNTTAAWTATLDSAGIAGNTRDAFVFNGATATDGGSGFITITAAAPFQLVDATKGASIAFWWRNDDQDTYARESGSPSLLVATSTSTAQFAINVPRGNTVKFIAQQFIGGNDYGHDETYTTSSDRDAGGWVHVVLTIDPTGRTPLIFYFNGQKSSDAYAYLSQDSVSLSAFTFNTIHVGGFPADGVDLTNSRNDCCGPHPGVINGAISDLAIYDYALTQLAVQNLYNAGIGAPPAGPGSGLYHGWTSPVRNCLTNSYDTTAVTADGGVYPYNAGDSAACRAWKLAATICNSEPEQYEGDANYFCASSGGFTDPTFGTFCAVSQQYACSDCPGACNAGTCSKGPISLRNCDGNEVPSPPPVPPSPAVRVHRPPPRPPPRPSPPPPQKPCWMQAAGAPRSCHHPPV